MYILAKRVGRSRGFAIHGLTASDREVDGWQALGGIVFDIDENDNATWGSYSPLPGPNDEVATDE